MRLSLKSKADWERRIDAARQIHQGADAMNDRGQLKAAYCKAVKAVAAWRLLQREKPTSMAAREGLGCALNLGGTIASKLGLRQEALKSAEEAFQIYGQLAGEAPGQFIPCEARTLANLGYHLRKVGLNDEAHNATRKALEIYFVLPEDRVPRRDMADLFASHGFPLRDLGMHEEAWEISKKEFNYRSTLARDNPEMFREFEPKSLDNLRKYDIGRREAALKKAESELRAIQQDACDRVRSPLRFQIWQDIEAKALNHFAICLSELGRFEESLKETRKVVSTYWQLAQENPGSFRFLAARSLSILSIRLGDLGRREEARRADKEAEGIYLQLARENPMEFMCNKARAADVLGVRVGEFWQRDEALKNAEDALQVFQQLVGKNSPTFMPYLAQSLTNLGYWLHAIGRRKEGVKAGEKALRIYRQLVRSHPGEFLPEQARTLNNLGIQLGDLGLRWDALRASEEALEIYRQLALDNPKAFTPYLGRCYSNVGFCLGDLGRREDALRAAAEALKIFRDLAMGSGYFWPDEARSVHNLGIALCDLGRHDEALKASEKSLSFYRIEQRGKPGLFDLYRARCLTNIGYCLVALGKTDEALEAANSALNIYTILALKDPQTFRADEARSLSNLVKLWRSRGEPITALKYAEEALDIYRQLALDKPKTFLPQIGRALNYLGNCLADLGRYKESLMAAEEALYKVREFGLRGLSSDLSVPAESHRQIALAKFQMGDLQAARRHLAAATRLIERNSSRLTRATDRELSLQRAIGCFRLRVQVALHCWGVKPLRIYIYEALQAAEMARSRNLLELMGDAERLPNARSLTRRAWLKHLRGVRQAEWRLDALERRATQAHGGTMSNRPATPRWAEERFAIVPVTDVSGQPTPAHPRELQEARAELRTARARIDRLVTEIRREDPDFDPFQPVRPLSARDQLAMVAASESEVWCISWLVTEHRTLAFVLAPGVQPVGLDLGEAGSNSMKEVAARLDWNGDSQQPTLRRVADLILWPLLKILPSEARDCLPGHLILVANGILQSLPLHALPLPDEWGGGCLGDRFATSTTPSLSLAHRLARSASTHCRGSLAVVNPESWSEGFLGFGALEGIAFREHHDQAKVCMGCEATVESLLEASASGPGIIHVSAHMGSDPKAPLESAIRLSDRLLPLRELYGRLRTDGTWLTILNGCESGVIGEAAAGNPEGLPLGFLFGGSTNVISTLHRVLDVSSALLMDRFHQELRPGVSASMALKRASDWLRGHHSVPDALVDGRAAARAIREFARRARTLRGKPKLSKPWREILRHCTDRAREVEPDCHPPFAALQHWAAHIAIGASWLPMPPTRKPRIKTAR